MNVFVFDCGNAIIKGKTATRETDYPHALYELSETDYQQVLTRSGRQGAPEDYLRVNGKPYVVGEQAERYPVSLRKGAARYSADYYGVFAAATLARLYDKGGDVYLFGSHPPGDVQHRDDLMDAALGTWEVETQGKTLTFRITAANTFDEPAGGLFNVILAQDGQHYARTDINGGRALVIDVGGFTTDWLAVNPGGEIDLSLQESTPLGILEVVKNFTRSFKARYAKETRDTSTIPIDRIRKAV